jgi:hypothetical protein
MATRAGDVRGEVRNTGKRHVGLANDGVGVEIAPDKCPPPSLAHRPFKFPDISRLPQMSW